MEKPMKTGGSESGLAALEAISKSTKEHVQEKFEHIKELRELGIPQEELDRRLLKARQEAAEKGLEKKETRAHIRAIESQAGTDVLTGLPNRRVFVEKLHSEVILLNRIERGHEVHENVYVLFIDLDHFKSINDTFGHDIGDLYLKTSAHFMHEKIHRESDMLARMGGDEFTVVLTGNDDTAALTFAKKLGEAVRQASITAKNEATALLSARGKEVPTEDEGNISASIGMASFRKGESSEALLKRADEAVYKAKEAGRDQVVVAE